MLEVHKRLTVRGSEAALDGFVERLTGHVDAGWRRDLWGEREANEGFAGVGHGTSYAFHWEGEC